MQMDARVDLIELQDYKDIDPNEAPIVALACGHFFTIETLDGKKEYAMRILCNANNVCV
jgi:hypothetical protein